MKIKAVAVYLRVSTLDQEKGIQSQEKALKDYCTNQGFPTVRFYRDKLSGKDLKRAGFERLQKDIFSGQISTIVVWKLDRISRSLQDGINVLCDWLNQGIRVVSISQQFDFSGSVGKLIASVLFAVAEMERDNIRENIKRGMKNAKAKGIKLGKRPKLFAADIKPMLESGMSITEVSNQLGKSRQAIYTALKR